MTSLPDPETTSYLAAGVISAAAVLFILPYWPMVIAIIAGIWAVLGASAFAKQAAQEAAVVSPAKDEPSEEELKNDD